MRKLLIGFFLLPFLFSIELANANENIENGVYEIPVALWHAYEDKVSMGNKGIEERAVISIADGGALLYLSVLPMTVGDITTSVTHIYHMDVAEQKYLLAEERDFSIRIPGKENRPRLFVIPLDGRQEYYDVLIDPKVALMGADPIKARIKVFWNELEELSSDEVPPYIKNTSEDLNKTTPTELLLEEIKIKDPGGLFGNVTVENLSRNRIEKLNLEIEPADQVKGYRIFSFEQPKEIPIDKVSGVYEDAPKISLGDGSSIFFDNVDSMADLYYIDEESIEKIELRHMDQGAFAENASYGIYVFVKREKANVSQSDKANPEGSSAEILRQAKPQIQPVNDLSGSKNPTANDPEERRSEEITQTAQSSEMPKVMNDEAVFAAGAYTVNYKKEHIGIVLMIMFAYMSMLLGGIYLCRKFLPLIQKERERSHYLMLYAIRKEKQGHE